MRKKNINTNTFRAAKFRAKTTEQRKFAELQELRIRAQREREKTNTENFEMLTAAFTMFFLISFILIHTKRVVQLAREVCFK